jgi:arylsulfatase A-like enzyme
VSEVVETRALFETVLEVLGVDVRRTGGAPSLLRSFAAESSAPQPAYSIVWLDDSQLSWGKRIKAVCVREGRWKLVHDVTRGRKFLYDLDNDPGERRDVRSAEPHSTARLEALLDTWLAQQLQARTGNSTAARDPATERALKALGYL